MDKFNRNFRLLIQKKDGNTLEVRRPFTIEFDVHRNNFSSANVASMRIYNLSKENRASVRLDQYDYENKNRIIEFYAGYGDNLSLGFKGNITQAWSVREGVDFITQIESFDAGYAYNNAVTDLQFPEGTLYSSVIDSLVNSLKNYGVERGAISNFEGTLPRGNSYSGNTTQLLRELSGGGFFIDNGKVYMLRDNQALDLAVPTISVDNGLLGTPTLEEQYLNFDMLFEPGLRVGQIINLKSQSADHFNGLHKIISIKHRGIISETVSGTAITSLGLSPGVFVTIPEG
jgi:hypothetical protein